LLSGCVPLPDRAGAAIAGQGKLPLARRDVSVEGKEDLQARMDARDAAEQPRERGVRLLAQAEPHHRVERER
jgi:hypothetical protein